MNHQERIELLNALVRSGVKHFKSGDTEISFGSQSVVPLPPQPGPSASGGVILSTPPESSPVDKEKLEKLVDTFKMDDEALIDKIFPAGAGG